MTELKVKVAKTMVKELAVRDRNFVIVAFDNGQFGAIEDKYITDGRLNKVLNGLQMFISDTIGEVVNRVRTQAEVDYLVANGKTLGEAICIAFKLPMDKAQTLDEIAK